MKAKYILLVAIAALLATTVTAKKQSVQKIYIYGMAATFTDTIVYFTPIQEVDSAWVDTKTNFLQGRENYSYQLREYLTSQQMPHRTCVVIYNQDRQKLEKEFLKMKRIYTTGKKKVKKKDKDNDNVKSNNELRTISSAEFKFNVVDMSGATDE